MLTEGLGYTGSYLSECDARYFHRHGSREYCTTIAFDRDYALLYCRASAHNSDADVFRSVDGHVSFVCPCTRAQITETLSRASASNRADASASLVFTQRRANGLPLILRISAERDTVHAVTGVLTIMDLNQRHHLPETLIRATFGLTNAEAALASSLAEGETVQEISLRTGVSVSTLRTQLASVLAKTGTPRQAQLVSLLSRLLILGTDDLYLA